MHSRRCPCHLVPARMIRKDQSFADNLRRTVTGNSLVSKSASSYKKRLRVGALTVTTQVKASPGLIAKTHPETGLFSGHRPFLYNRAMQAEIGRPFAVALYVVAMAAVIVGVDFVFFRSRFWERLTVNIGIVLVFAAFYLRFLKRP